jgi:hypothetical protein
MIICMHDMPIIYPDPMLVCTWHAHVALPYWLMVREASVTLALYSSLPWVASSAAHVALPY